MSSGIQTLCAAIMLWLEPMSAYKGAVIQTVFAYLLSHGRIQLALHLFFDFGAYVGNMLMAVSQTCLKAVSTEQKLQSEDETSTVFPIRASTSLTDREKTYKRGKCSANPPRPPRGSTDPIPGHEHSRNGYLSTSNRLKPQQRAVRRVSLRRLRLVGTRIAITILASPLVSAHPLIPQTTLPTLASLISEADGTDPEQVSGSNPYTWVTILCFFMILAGFAYGAWVCKRTWTPQYSLVLSGLFSLAFSIVWTAILYTVDTNDNRRYLVLGCWSMLIIAFVSETYDAVNCTRQYAFMIVPTFLLALHLALFLVNQQIDSDKAQIWDLRRFYENAPLAFTLWAMLLCLIYHRPASDGDPNGAGDPSVELDNVGLAVPGEGGQ